MARERGRQARPAGKDGMKVRRLGRDGPELSSIGFGTMGLSIAGRPPEEAAIETMHVAFELGVTVVDTAAAYCLDDSELHHSERLIRKAIQEWGDPIFVATKCGCVRPDGAWRVDGRPEALIESVHGSLKALGVETLDLIQLHAPDAKVPFAESVGTLARLRDEGKVRYIGVSNVTVSHIEQARRVTTIHSVQNRWSPMDRSPERDGVLAYCERHDLTFFAYSPFGGAREAPTLGILGKLGAEARKRRVPPYRLVMAWMLAKSPAVIPLPGARRPESIADTAPASALSLGLEDIAAVEAAFP